MYTEKRFKYIRNKSKYNNKTCGYNNSIYDSKLEKKFAMDLDLRVAAGEIKSWERQVKISLDVNKKHICNYYIDFIINHNDGSEEYTEIKGFPTEVWKLKWKLFNAIYGDFPNIKLSVVYK